MGALQFYMEVATDAAEMEGVVLQQRKAARGRTVQPAVAESDGSDWDRQKARASGLDHAQGWSTAATALSPFSGQAQRRAAAQAWRVSVKNSGWRPNLKVVFVAPDGSVLAGRRHAPRMLSRPAYQEKTTTIAPTRRTVARSPTAAAGGARACYPYKPRAQGGCSDEVCVWMGLAGDQDIEIASVPARHRPGQRAPGAASRAAASRRGQPADHQDRRARTRACGVMAETSLGSSGATFLAPHGATALLLVRECQRVDRRGVSLSDPAGRRLGAVASLLVSTQGHVAIDDATMTDEYGTFKTTPKRPAPTTLSTGFAFGRERQHGKFNQLLFATELLGRQPGTVDGHGQGRNGQAGRGGAKPAGGGQPRETRATGVAMFHRYDETAVQVVAPNGAWPTNGAMGVTMHPQAAMRTNNTLSEMFQDAGFSYLTSGYTVSADKVVRQPAPGRRVRALSAAERPGGNADQQRVGFVAPGGRWQRFGSGHVATGVPVNGTLGGLDYTLTASVRADADAFSGNKMLFGQSSPHGTTSTTTSRWTCTGHTTAPTFTARGAKPNGGGHEGKVGARGVRLPGGTGRIYLNGVEVEVEKQEVPTSTTATWKSAWAFASNDHRFKASSATCACTSAPSAPRS